ncbi:MAG: PEF-CTERM sorting domain-containing protein [Euryarchaeota archaeon]|nr:PEF-CTERM sorting domain-containing protein [Euryarchaeota archaeon]
MNKLGTLIISGLLIACMAGSAMADPGDIELWDENFQNRVDSGSMIRLKAGESIYISTLINYFDSAGSPELGVYNYGVELEYFGGAQEGDFIVECPDSFTLTEGGSPYSDQGVIKITRSNREIPYGAYCRISIGDENRILASGTTYAQNIPEFPTVALPVAAILGLVFIFGRKKEEL